MTRESLLMAVREDEAEPTIVEVSETQATFRLDDGEALVFDLAELRAAVALPAGRR